MLFAGSGGNRAMKVLFFLLAALCILCPPLGILAICALSDYGNRD